MKTLAYFMYLLSITAGVFGFIYGMQYFDHSIDVTLRYVGVTTLTGTSKTIHITINLAMILIATGVFYLGGKTLMNLPSANDDCH